VITIAGFSTVKARFDNPINERTVTKNSLSLDALILTPILNEFIFVII